MMDHIANDEASNNATSAATNMTLLEAMKLEVDQLKEMGILR